MNDKTNDTFKDVFSIQTPSNCTTPRLNLYSFDVNDFADAIYPFGKIRSMAIDNPWYQSDRIPPISLVAIETKYDSPKTYNFYTIRDRVEFLSAILEQAIEWYNDKLHGKCFVKEDSDYYSYKRLQCQLILRDKLGAK